ncbi:MAG: hypothetical protein GFH25_541324n28 [Chloroflexi bacterium AL-N10]|nr:hypothetical protein [Chloroflexi bacterium AL-N10]
MVPTTKDIAQQQHLLNTHRRTLAHYLQQAAMHGDAYTPPGVMHGITAARTAIQHCKDTLRGWGVIVEDHPDDEAPAPTQQTTASRVTHTTPSSVDQRQGVFISGGTVHGTVIGHQTNYYQVVERPPDRNRMAMLAKIRTMWIDDYLQPTFATTPPLDIGLITQPDMVDVPLHYQYQELQRSESALPVGTTLMEVFAAAGGSLALLGAPGSGKTTLLVTLVRDLLDRAIVDSNHPIPIICNLASWGRQQKAFAQWLVDELHQIYDVPRPVAQQWVMQDMLLLILDGLDEVQPDARAACVQAINIFRADHGFVPLVVGSRYTEYAMLPVQLRVHSAVTIQPLTRTHIETYLTQHAQSPEVRHALLRPDSIMDELLTTPLTLQIALLAAQANALPMVTTRSSPDAHRHTLWTIYIEHMFTRRSQRQTYPQHQTRHWLRWLAAQMVTQQQALFSIDDLQPTWLQVPNLRLRYTILDRIGTAGGAWASMVLFGVLMSLCVSLIYEQAQLPISLWGGLHIGLVIGFPSALIGGLFGGHDHDPPRGPRAVVSSSVRSMAVIGMVVGVLYSFIFDLSTGLISGVLASLLGGLAGALTGLPRIAPRQIILVETLRWSWRRASRAMVMTLGLSIGLGFTAGAIVGLIQEIYTIMQANNGQPGYLLGYGMGTGLVGGGILGTLLAILRGLQHGLVGDTLPQRIYPNQGIWRSLRSALISGSVLGVLAGVVVAGFGMWATGITGAVLFGSVSILTVGVVSGLAYGGLACCSHLALRLVLWHTGYMPWQYRQFLDDCADRMLLRRVGGRYIFWHRSLMDYFATVDE